MLIKLYLIAQMMLFALGARAVQPEAQVCAGFAVNAVSVEMVDSDATPGPARIFASHLSSLGVGRGPAILIGSMLATAAVGAQLTKQMPPEFAFLMPFMSQFLALGIYELSSPFFDPLRSRIRRLAFSLKAREAGPSDERLDLEDQWRRSANALTVNAQMSRNVISSFLAAAVQNFDTARIAFASGNIELCANQIADVVVRMRVEFPEISPSNESIARAADAAFRGRVRDHRDLLEPAIWAGIRRYDSRAGEATRHLYYEQLLSAWLDFDRLSQESGR